MFKRVAAIVFIYVCTVLAWLILGTTVNIRTSQQDTRLKSAVGQLWGTTQRQQAPDVYYLTRSERRVETIKGALSDLFMGRCPSCRGMGRRKSVVAEAPEGNLAVWGEVAA